MPPTLAGELGRFRAATDILEQSFPDAGPKLWKSELLNSYSFSDRVSADWMRDQAPALVTALLRAGFVVEFEIRVTSGDSEKKSVATASMSSGNAVIMWAPRLRLPLLPNEVYHAARELSARSSRLESFVSKLLAVHEAAARHPETGIDLTFKTNLTKKPVRDSLLPMLSAPNAKLGVEFMLFPHALAHLVKHGEPGQLAALLSRGVRTCVIVAAMDGVITGDLVIVAGGGPDAVKNEAVVVNALAVDATPALAISARAQAFLQNRLAWADASSSPPAPEYFKLRSVQPHSSGAAAVIESFNRTKAVLSLAFLANRVQPPSSARPSWQLEFLGQLRRRPELDEAAQQAAQRNHQAAYDLYWFVYEEASDVKLEIVQRMAALVAGNQGAALFTQAVETREAAEQAFADVMEGRVREYFTARQNARDYVQKSVSETESATMELTRDVGERLFKAAGLVAAAVVAAGLDTDLSDRAGFVASLSLVVYLALALRYYCAPLRRSALNRQKQYIHHIRGFSDVLGMARTRALIKDAHVKAAWKRYATERIRTIWFLTAALVVAVVATAIFGSRLM